MEQVYNYWFGENMSTWSKTYPLNTKLWFKVQETIDREIKERFEPVLIDAAMTNSTLYQDWKTTDRGKLALILLFDQLARNMYRGTAKMFQYDSLALDLTLEIISNPSYQQTYSLPERLFIYMPLVHSEDLQHTSKGAELLETLAAEVPQRDIRRRYTTNARSARVHQQVIETFGRYPHRNDLLERISTPEEIEYLKIATNGFVKSVQLPPPTPVVLQTTNKKPPLRILVLHSLHQNANSMKRGAKKVFRELKDVATFYYANAPLPYNPSGEVKEQLLEAFGDENLPDVGYQRQWWNASKDNKIYHHLDVSLHFLDQLFKTEGPFDGIFGFSQGATLTGILSGLQPSGNISFRFAILISGFVSRATCHEEIMKPGAIKNIPSLHVYGLQDLLVTNDRTLQLAQAFENSIIVTHLGGHFTPNSWPTARIKQFLLDQQKDPIEIPIDSSPSSLTKFEEKLEAMIIAHQKQRTITTADDSMLRIWSERTIFYNPEPVLDQQAPLFFQHWISLFKKNPDELLADQLSLIPKFGSWADIKTLYAFANDLDTLKKACVQLFADQLRKDHQGISNQWISLCAKEAPRISNNPKNINTIMAKEIALVMNPFSPGAFQDERKLRAEKGYAYILYKRLISTLCHVLEKASPIFVNEQIKSRTRKDRAFRLTKEQREELLKGPPSSFITNPEPEPVVPCALEDLQPLFEHLTTNKPGPSDDQQPVVFAKGTIMTGGRLDLCKQVVGPQGIQPLLNAMKRSEAINRLLLGNNIVGLPGAQAISDYIRNNVDSHIDTWYIAGNNFDGEAMKLICDALIDDEKVKALWLKRNPILADGVVHISDMLMKNHRLETLDLLNTGLLDEGCEIVFRGLKSNRTLKHLYLDTNGLTVRSGKIIRQHLENGENQLESLYLSCNAFGDDGTLEIAAGLQNDQRLKRLGLASNCIGAESARALTDALISHRSLEQLNLGFMKATILLGGLDNVIGDEGATHIARLIRSNSIIRSIDLTFNGISQRGLLKLRDALKENSTLTTLKFLQFGQIHSEITKEELNLYLETNQIRWGKEFFNSDEATRAECLRKGQQLNEMVNYPPHVMEIISYYRTH